jgi:hypothetical protein
MSTKSRETKWLGKKERTGGNVYGKCLKQWSAKRHRVKKTISRRRVDTERENVEANTNKKRSLLHQSVKRNCE